jgi:hypothetical protein
MVAYCGLICTDCDAYIATQAQDMEALARMAEKASAEMNMELTVADAMCDGCRATTGRQIGYCQECAIRLCGLQHHIDTCAACDDYSCAEIEAFSPPGSEHRATLDDLRAKQDSAR